MFISRTEYLAFGSLRATIYADVFAPRDMSEHACLKLKPVYKMGIFRLGLVWFNMVQRGSDLTEKGDE